MVSLVVGTILLILISYDVSTLCAEAYCNFTPSERDEDKCLVWTYPRNECLIDEKCPTIGTGKCYLYRDNKCPAISCNKIWYIIFLIGDIIIIGFIVFNLVYLYLYRYRKQRSYEPLQNF